MRLAHELATADVILCMGSNDLASARYAAELYFRELASIIVMSGGVAHGTDLLATGWTRSEAAEFADAAHKLGVPKEAMLLEERSSNTSENFTFSRKLLEHPGRKVKSAIVVHKPYMERRAYATGRVAWPEVRLLMSSTPCSLRQYLLFNHSPVSVINVMLGDLQRIDVYGGKGMLEKQAIPAQVMDNFRELVRLGFNRHLLRDEH